MHRAPPTRRSFRPWPLLSVLALVLVLSAARSGGDARSVSPPVHDMSSSAMSPGSTRAMPSMSDAEMRAAITRIYASHPARPAAIERTLAAPVDSFTAVNFRFEHDGNAATQIDTVKIQAGQSVRFKFGGGFHTVTSGTGSADPNSGLVFDHPMMVATDQFDFQFDDAGIVPFYCQFHETFNMKGVVVVSSNAAVGPYATHVGFVSALAPNPSSHGVSFRFALARPGRARLEVFDAQGRRVAVPIDRDMPAGEFAGSWDGRNGAGARVAAGSYTLRLEVPGTVQSRQAAQIR